jgi:protein-disulfide isomerase
MPEKDKEFQVLEFTADAEKYPDGKPGIIDSMTPGNMAKKVIRSKMYLALLALGIVFVFSVLYASGAFTGFFGANANVLSPEVAGQKTVDFVNSYLITDGNNATLESVTEESDMYKVSTLYQDQTIPIYTSKDGKFVILPQGLIDVEAYKVAAAAAEQTETPATTEVPKTDKPAVDVFVMSYCPYGLQIEKAVIPVMNLLGSKADIKIRFVHYVMHGAKEVDENTVQYCIQKEQADKYVNYLTCFVQGNDTATCQTSAGIDKTKLDACLAATDKEFNITASKSSSDQYPRYLPDAALSNQFGVQGSPTLVINGVEVSAARSPEAVKEAVCNAFTTAPAECDQALSSNQAAAGQGPMEGGSGSGSAASCGS